MAEKINPETLHELEKAHLARDRASRGISPFQPSTSLALSGGGIRAATYALGVVEALKEARIWQSLSYVSSVSGGGLAATSSLYGPTTGPELIDKIHSRKGYLSTNMLSFVLLILMAILSLLTISTPLFLCIVWTLPFAVPGNVSWITTVWLASAAFVTWRLLVLALRSRLGDRFRDTRIAMSLMFVLLACGALQTSKVVDPFWLNAGAGAMLILALGLLARPDRFAFRQIPFAAGVALAAISLLTLGFSVTRFLIKDRLPDNRDALLAAAFAMAVPFFVVNPDMLNVARRKYLKGLRNFFLERQDPTLDGRAAARPGPFPIINSFLQAPGSENDEVRQEGGDNFIVTPLHCGSRCTGYYDLSSWSRKGWRHTEKYYRLSDLVAASAAALDTRYVGQSKLASVLAVALNLGLGRWFLNPAGEAPRRRWSWPTHFDNFITLFDSHAETAHWIRLSDGGHYENLGLFELVARWSDVFVVVDAAHDPHYQYLDLYTATRLCRERLGATIEIPSLKPGRQHARDAYEGTITSAAGKVAKLHYLKLAVADHHRLELRVRACADPLFPQEPTTNQFLDKDQMTAYFDLGKATATRIGASLRADAFGKHPPAIHAAI